MKKYLLTIILLVHGVVVLYFWLATSGPTLGHTLPSTLIALGRLAGLILVTQVLLQLTLMGRVRLFETQLGLDGLAYLHQKNGKWILATLILHPLLLILGYKILAGQSILAQTLQFLRYYEDVLNAGLAMLMFLGIIVYSWLMARRKWNFELWYFVHLFTYLAVLIAFGHQGHNGAELNAYPIFNYYWTALYGLVALNLVFFRFLIPVLNFFEYNFTVSEVKPETYNVTSVSITGQNLQNLEVLPGQFFLLRFFQRGLWWESHPFSLSKYPDGQTLRFTIKASGNFTAKIPQLVTGTKVMVEGPYGIFTPKRSVTKKVLLVAGGIGITPIRGVWESLLQSNKDTVLLYANKTEKDIALKSEIDTLSNKFNGAVHYILSDQPSWTGPKGIIDLATLQQLVPDVALREVFLCGPPSMMSAIRQNLQTLGVPKNKIYFEKFSLT